MTIGLTLGEDLFEVFESLKKILNGLKEIKGISKTRKKEK